MFSYNSEFGQMNANRLFRIKEGKSLIMTIIKTAKNMYNLR